MLISDFLLFTAVCFGIILVIIIQSIIEKYCELRRKRKRSQYEAELEEWKHKWHLQWKIKRSNDPLWQLAELKKRLGYKTPPDTVIK